MSQSQTQLADDGSEFGLNENRETLLLQPSATEWRASGPSALVERKRFFRLGPHESGRVTSLVRYRPNAEFPKHPHPQGEEIFVLEGKFVDWRGEHSPGTFLLNPEGFEHAPKVNNMNINFDLFFDLHVFACCLQKKIIRLMKKGIFCLFAFVNILVQIDINLQSIQMKWFGTVIWTFFYMPIDKTIYWFLSICDEW